MVVLDADVSASTRICKYIDMPLQQDGFPLLLMYE
jgi:hypothetical protein